MANLHDVGAIATPLFSDLIGNAVSWLYNPPEHNVDLDLCTRLMREIREFSHAQGRENLLRRRAVFRVTPEERHVLMARMDPLIGYSVGRRGVNMRIYDVEIVVS